MQKLSRTIIMSNGETHEKDRSTSKVSLKQTIKSVLDSKFVQNDINILRYLLH